MASVTARTVLDRLKDPRERSQVVQRTDTDQLNKLKTKAVFQKRKEKLLHRLVRGQLQKQQPNNERALGQLGDSRSSSSYSELNFADDDARTTPKPTLSGGGGHGGDPGEEEGAAAAPIDMGDYENRIRPSSDFWRLADGMTMADKIIYYRNWKYLNHGGRSGHPEVIPVHPAVHNIAAPVERSHSDGPLSPRAALRPVTSHRRASSADAAPPPTAAPAAAPARPELRGISVIPLVARRPYTPVTPIDYRRVASTPNGRGGGLIHKDTRLPDIEHNQFVVARRREKSFVDSPQRVASPLSVRPKSTKEEEEEEEEDEEEPQQPPPPPQSQQPQQKFNFLMKTEPPRANPINEVAFAPVAAAASRRRVRPPLGPKAPMPSSEPDALIRKLDRKVERDLRGLQGLPPAEDDVPGVDDHIDDGTMRDIVNGERARQVELFLKAY